MDQKNINYRPGIGKVDALKLLEANGVDLSQPVDDFNWRVIEGRDENGQMHREFYPVSEPHETARIQARGETIDYDRILEEKAAEAEKAEKVIESQNDMIGLLMARMEALEANQLPLESMTPFQLKKIAKQRGIDIKGLSKKDELLEALKE